MTVCLRRNLTKLSCICISAVLVSFALGFAVCYWRIFPYQQVRGLADLLRYQTGKITPIASKPMLFLLGDSNVRRADWSFLDDSYASVNLGQGGARVSDVLCQIEKNKSLAGETAILLIGLNDLADRRSVEEILEEIHRCLLLLQKRGTKVLVLGIPLVPGTGEFDRRATIKILNDYLCTLSDELSEVSFLNLNSVWADQGSVKVEYLSDRLHLTQKAFPDASQLLEEKLLSL